MPCCIYKDPVLYTAQSLSIVAFIFGCGDVISFILGLAAMIVLQVVWCCRMNRGGLTAAAVFALVAGAVNVIVGIATLTTWKEDICWNGDDDDDNNEECNYKAWAAAIFVGAACWVTVAALVFYFLSSGRFDRCWDESGPPMSPVGSTVAAVHASPAVAAGSCVTNVSYLPDGTKKTETITYNPDGSMTVQETLEKTGNTPAEP